ncbi:GAF domain-containing protein [bacterium]|nr:GAF domain-containing protein [bacterium]
MDSPQKLDAFWIELLGPQPGKAELNALCAELIKRNPDYSWVGFYIMNQAESVLELGPFVGPPTDHTKIPYGRGICGQVAVSGTTMVVDDVSASDNYLACSIDVKSEVVLPIYRGTELVAQLDIDSNRLNAFGPDDLALLEPLCAYLGEVVEHWRSLVGLE